MRTEYNMNNFDVSDALVNRGLDPEIASQIEMHVKGTDLVNLINALQSNTSESTEQINDIIKKFGVSLNNEEPDDNVEEDNEYLSDLFKGEDVDDLKFLKNSEHTLDNAAIRNAGFKYEATVPYNKCDDLMDWLDDRGIQYLTNGKGEFDIKCDDREQLYKLNKFLSKITNLDLLKSSKEKEPMRKVNEGIMGLTPMGKINSPINRLMELAGVRDSVIPVSDDDEDTDVITTIPDDTTDIDPMSGDVGDDMGGDVSPIDSDIDANTVTPEACSPAMNQISDYLNNIQNAIPDIKMAEYKTLIIKIRDLADQVSSMGKGYLED